MLFLGCEKPQLIDEFNLRDSLICSLNHQVSSGNYVWILSYSIIVALSVYTKVYSNMNRFVVNQIHINVSLSLTYAMHNDESKTVFKKEKPMQTTSVYTNKPYLF